MASATANVIEADATLEYAPANFKKWLVRLALPNLSGGTPTAARIHVNATGAAVGSVVIASYVLATNPAISGGAFTDLAGTLDGLSLGTQLDSGTFSGSGDKSWDILGDATKGLIKAYNDGLTSITVLLFATAFTGGAVSRNDGPNATQALGDPVGFNVQVYDGASGTTPPYVDITYTPAAGNVPTAPNGSAGLLMA